ncbi:MAG TPA: hypothetical protein VGR96_10635 [Acidobacteriaceae bacterium]|nr:hypothetical protein [Acidobacteriaceae bacterium]
MSALRIAVLTSASSLSRDDQRHQPMRHKTSLEDRLDKVFQAAEHVDAKCVHLLDAAAQKRRAAFQARYYGYK